MNKENISTLDVKIVNVPDISFETVKYVSLIFYTGVCQTIATFGVGTNILNIICFVKQGFKESINISLLGLAISDLLSLMTLIFTCISFTLVFTEVEMPFEVFGVAYLVANHPHATFTRVTCWITAVITLERCMCVIAPLKVKLWVTPKRVCIAIIFVFIIIIFSVSPVYVVNRLDMIFSPQRNMTIFGLVITNDRENVEKISMSINNFFIPIAACIIIIICTIILVISLLKNSEWRKTSMKANDVDIRNKRVAKMVVMISALFISCFLPVTTILLTFAFVPDMSVTGINFNTTIILSSIGLMLEAINSSTNIFIYYRMSSKYKDTFRNIFFQCRPKNSLQAKLIRFNTE